MSEIPTHIRHCILYEFQLGNSASAAARNICAALGDDAIADRTGSGELVEAFGAGTAAIIAPVGKIAYRGKEWVINGNATGELTRELYDTITGIQLGEIEDRHGWNRLIQVENGEEAQPLRASG